MQSDLSGQYQDAKAVAGAQAAASIQTSQPVLACPSCGKASELTHSITEMPFVYAIGYIEPRFPRIDVEKEFAQVLRRAETSGLTDRQALQKILVQSENRYLARQLCWIMSIEGIETYILTPRDAADLELLIESLRPVPSPIDIDVVIGARGPVAPSILCNGLMLPTVVIDQTFSFDRNSFIRAIPKPKEMSEEQFEPAASELLDRILQIADNTGSTDEHRALNYLAVRYPAIYVQTAMEIAQNHSIANVIAIPSRLSGVHKVVDVILSYVNRSTDVIEKYFVRVDVSGRFPFLRTKLSPYFDR